MIVRTVSRPLSSAVSSSDPAATSRASERDNHSRTRPSSGTECVRRERSATTSPSASPAEIRSSAYPSPGRSSARPRRGSRSRTSPTSDRPRRSHADEILSACVRRSRFGGHPFSASTLAYPTTGIVPDRRRLLNGTPLSRRARLSDKSESELRPLVRAGRSGITRVALRSSPSTRSWPWNWKTPDVGRWVYAAAERVASRTQRQTPE